MAASPSARTQSTSGDPEPPVPCDHPQGYTKDRIVAGRDYADHWLAQRTRVRKITPITQKVLQVYRSACVSFLENVNDFTEQELLRTRREIFEYEQNVQKNWFLKSFPTGIRLAAFETVLQLRQFQYYARYADYAQRLVSKVRFEARLKNVEGWDRIGRGKTWLQIEQDLKEENPAWKQLQQLVESEEKQFEEDPANLKEAPTHAVLRETSKKLGIDFKRVLWSINMYASRNELLHSGLDNLLAKGNTINLAQQLYDDRQEVANTMNAENPVDELMLNALILGLIEEWFEMDEGDYHEPTIWLQTEALKQEIKKRRPAKKQAGEKNVVAENDAMVARVAQKALDKAKREGQEGALIDLLINLPGHEGGLPDPESIGAQSQSGAKRKASQQSINDEVDARQSQMKTYNEIIRGYKNVHDTLHKNIAAAVHDLRTVRSKQTIYHETWAADTKPPQEVPTPGSAQKPAVPGPRTSSTTPVRGGMQHHGKSLSAGAAGRAASEPNIQGLSIQGPQAGGSASTTATSGAIPPPPTVPPGWITVWDANVGKYRYMKISEGQLEPPT